MIPIIYQFGERREQFSETWPVPALVINAAIGCGKVFKEAGYVLEPESENPCVYFNNPIGVKGVRTILDMLDARKKSGS